MHCHANGVHLSRHPHNILFCVTVKHFALQRVDAPRGLREPTAALCSAAALAAQDLSGPPATGRLPGPGPGSPSNAGLRATPGTPGLTGTRPSLHLTTNVSTSSSFPLREAGPIPIPLRWVSLHSEQTWSAVTDFALAARQGVTPLFPASTVNHLLQKPTSHLHHTGHRSATVSEPGPLGIRLLGLIGNFSFDTLEKRGYGRRPSRSLSGAWLESDRSLAEARCSQSGRASSARPLLVLVSNRPAAPGSGRHRGTSKVTGSMTGDGTISGAGGSRDETIDLHPLPLPM